MRQTSVVRVARLAAAILALASVAGHGQAAAQSPPAAATPEPLILSVVGTNDLHGGVLPRDGRGGLALLSGYVRNLRAARAADGGDVLLIDAGDMFHGTLESNLTEGAVVVAAYNALGYAAAAVGNHEFDFGPVGPHSTPQESGDDPRGALKARAAEAAFPFLAANLIDEATGRPVAWPNVTPAVLIERAGVRVGIIGVMTAGALRATIAANVKALTVAPLVPVIAEHARRLRDDGATVVIVTAHAGGRCGAFDNAFDLSTCDTTAEIVRVAQDLPAALVDVIVAGHFHNAVAHVVAGIPIIESYANGRAFGRVDLVVDRATGAVIDRRVLPPRDLCAFEQPTGACAAEPGATATRARYEERPVMADPAVAGILAPAVQEAEALKARPIGVVLETRVRRQAGGESPLGNLVADAIRASIPGADVALHNTTGGLRTDLPAGPLTYGAIYEVMPFDNRIVPLPLSGAELREVLARQLQRSSRLVGVAGLQVHATCGTDGVKIDLLRDTGRPIGDDESLVVAASDFLAMGGDDILTPVIPSGGFPIAGDAPFARDALAAHLRSRGERLYERDFAGVRTVVPGGLPISCSP